MAASEGKDQVIDAAIWEVLKRMIYASNMGELQAFRSASAALGGVSHEGDARPGTYMYYLLNRQIASVLQKRVPSDDDLSALADIVLPNSSRILKDGKNVIINVMRDVFGRVDEDSQLTGYRFVFVASVVLGVLMKDPTVELAMLRPQLADWYQRKVIDSH